MKQLRTRAIRDYIGEKGEVTVEELCTLFPERSAMTIRRDLALLESQQQIIRTHGGARIAPVSRPAQEDFYAERELDAVLQKELIAQKAARLAQGLPSIYIDSGTTAMAFARALPDQNMTVMTSGPNIAMLLVAKRKNIQVLLVGGSLNPKTLSCAGPGAFAFLENLNIDTAFLGTSGFSVDSGFTSGDYAECEVKRAIVARCKHTVLLMDSTKIDRTMPFTFARPSEIDTLVSDGELPARIVEEMRRQNVEIL